MFNRFIKKLFLPMICIMHFIHSSAYYKETLVGIGMGITTIGTIVSSIGIHTILKKEEAKENPSIIIDTSESNSSNIYIVNFDPRSNTAKGTICTTMGIFVAYAGIRCILESFN